MGFYDDVYQEGITIFGRATPILDIFPSNIPMFAWAIASITRVGKPFQTVIYDDLRKGPTAIGSG